VAAFPRITVVTPSYNQGRFIGRTIESVLAQNYPDLEHVVVDGASTDDTPAVLARYPHLRTIREPDRGQAEAINKGFRAATGDVLCFLNSDDTFLPGTLRRVAEAIDPARGRHVVMGRCIFVDANDQPTGMEHPCAFSGHERVLQVWKGHCIPQPATFWSAEAWRRCGPLDEREQLVLDYDLMCRLSRRYHFHVIDEVLATYRLHEDSKTCSNQAADTFAQATRVSRRYWGPWWGPRYWRLRASLALFPQGHRDWRRQQAASLTVGACQALEKRLPWRRFFCRLSAAVLAPEAALRRWLLHAPAPLRHRLPRLPTAAHTWQSRWLPAPATVWRSFTGQHGDGHVGPRFTMPVQVPPGGGFLHLDGEVNNPGPLPEPLVVTAAVAGRPLAEASLGGRGAFRLSVPLAGLRPGRHDLEVGSSWFRIPDDFWGNGDYRPLAFRLVGVTSESESQSKGAVA
jgi:glycosyltransferase involved in cell wall biosynthesis